MTFRLSLVASAAIVALSPLAVAQDRTASEQQAREIFRNVVEIRSARGQSKVPEVVDYLVGELKAAGFSDEDIEVTDYNNDGEETQGLVVWYRATNPTEKPIALLAHMDVVDALAEDWVLDPYTLTEGTGTSSGAARLTTNMVSPASFRPSFA